VTWLRVLPNQETQGKTMENNEAARTYRVWGIDKVAYGPVELPTLVNWIKLERVIGENWIFIEPDNTWSKVRQLPELKMFFKSKSPTSSSDTTLGGMRTLGLKPDSLRRIKIFADLEDRQLESFLHYLELLSYKPFVQVVRKGDHGDAMYLVLEGELRACVLIDGKETTLSTLAVGDCFGEVSLLDQGPRSADVVANEPSTLLKLSAASFTRLLREAPALATPFLFALNKSVVGRVRTLTNRYEDSIHLSRAAGVVQ
jgi:cyclic nucleotide-binding protein